ncbi:MAG: DnaD domain protein [Ruminococcus sp.]|nr:DnaD domain protein [Ruminococcus sp.]
MIYKIGVSAFGRFFTVPCSAVENYIKFADPDFYKVLLCVLCQSGCKVESQEIAAQCGLPEQKVIDALEYWSSNEVISAKADNETKMDAKPTYVDFKASSKDEKPQATSQSLPVCATDAINPMKNTAAAKSVIRYTPKELAEKAKSNAELKALYEEIQKILGRPINPSETAGLVNLYEYYGYSAASILIMAQFCHDIGKDRIAYLETVAKDWFSRGICSYDQVEEEIVRQTEANSQNARIARALEIEGSLTKRQKEYFDQWRDWDFDLRLIELASERCREQKNKIDIRYINGILKNWHEKGLKTTDDVANSDIAYKAAKEKRLDKQRKESAPSFDLDEWQRMADAMDPNDLSFEEVDDF